MMTMKLKNKAMPVLLNEKYNPEFLSERAILFSKFELNEETECYIYPILRVILWTAHSRF